MHQICVGSLKTCGHKERLLDVAVFPVIVGAREEVCVTAEEVLSLLQKGSAVRHTGATQMNELSSRSHAIFSVHMIQVH